MKKLLLSILITFAAANVSTAQELAIKWNPLYLPLGALNLGAEFSLCDHLAITGDGMVVMFNPLKNSNPSAYANGWTFSLGARIYPKYVFHGFHFGIYQTAGRFTTLDTGNYFFMNLISGGAKSPADASNVKLLMTGLTIGYSLPLGGDHWFLDFFAGAGAAYGKYTQAGVSGEQNMKVGFNLQKVAASLTYKF